MTSPDAMAPSGVTHSAAPAGSLVYIISGNGQAGQPGTVVGPRDLGVVVRKSDGTPVANNTTVTFTCAGDGCAVSNATVLTAGGTGIASTRWRLPTATGTATATAQVSGGGSVTFTANVGGAILASTLTKDANSDGQTATSGQNVSVDPSVTVKDAGGNPLAGAIVTFTPDLNGAVSNSVVTSDANGRAVTSWRLPTTNGTTTSTLTATANGGAIVASFTANLNPIPGSLTKVSNTPSDCGSRCAPGVYAGPGDPAVQLKDNQGNVLASTAGVLFSANGGALSNPNATTDGSGYASTRWRLPVTPGTYTLTVSVPAYPNVASVSFTATVAVGSATQLVIIGGGNNQTVAAGQVAPTDPTIEVEDVDGNAVSGQVVTFAASGNGAVSNSVVTTGASGIAGTTWRLPTSGPFTMNACINGGALCTTFTATSRALVNSMQYAQGNGQSAPAGTVVPRDPAVIVRDVNGNTIDGVVVSFAVTSGNGVLSWPTAVTSGGIAAVTWRLGSGTGSQSITATVTDGGVTRTLVFTATAQ